jgi:hypothetical protein
MGHALDTLISESWWEDVGQNDLLMRTLMKITRELRYRLFFFFLFLFCSDKFVSGLTELHLCFSECLVSIVWLVSTGLNLQINGKACLQDRSRRFGVAQMLSRLAESLFW